MIPQIQENEPEKREYTIFTKREKEVIAMIADGLSTKVIAQKCFLSSETVSTHRKNIIRKIKASNAVEAVARAFRMGLIS